MCRLGFIYHDEYLNYSFGNTHPMNKLRIKMHMDLLDSIDFFNSSKVKLFEPEPCTVEDILSVHTQEYVDLIKKFSLTGEGQIDNDTPAFKGMYDVSMRAVGGTMRAVDLLMMGEVEHAWNPLGGFHHAKPDRGAGFCIFNDIAIAIKRLLNKYGLKRVLYLDLDAHHGDGVQQIFYGEDRVFKISMHESGKTLYPYTGFVNERGEGAGEEAKGQAEGAEGRITGHRAHSFRQGKVKGV